MKWTPATEWRSHSCSASSDPIDRFMVGLLGVCAFNHPIDLRNKACDNAELFYSFVIQESARPFHIAIDMYLRRERAEPWEPNNARQILLFCFFISSQPRSRFHNSFLCCLSVLWPFNDSNFKICFVRWWHVQTKIFSGNCHTHAKRMTFRFQLKHFPYRETVGIAFPRNDWSV